MDPDNLDNVLLAYGQQHEDAHRRYSDTTLAFDKAEEAGDLLQIELLKQATDEELTTLLAIQFAIAQLPAQTLMGLRVKARVFASRWSNLDQMRRWSIEHHTARSQDPQEMIGISIMLDLLDGALS
ncbi:hypothetical protein [Methylocella sp. CPCC 101449]|uniref:hypothetical protein n=1 Tax=Methylocella sp. CPCC 101449 TaxID=2987531 RepID=UPI002890671D|nr:hypothetical protein [Methylocella sp. CPCC 101449]MDT2021200.1 hypothetical protein [Methylocella sp. CPCC 101449]